MSTEPERQPEEPREISLTGRVARWSIHHRKSVFFTWVAIVIAAILVSGVIGTNTDMKQSAPGDAGRGLKLIEQRFGVRQRSAQEIVVFSHHTMKVTDPVYRRTVQDLMTKLTALRWDQTGVKNAVTLSSSQRIVSATATDYDIGTPANSPFVAQNSTGGDVSFAIVTLNGEAVDAAKHIQPLVDAVTRADAQAKSNGFDISVGGDATIQKQVGDQINEDMQFALILNLVVTFVILILAFRTVAAAVVPIALALGAVVTATGILGLISQAYPLSQIYSEVVLLMGLATGIDYALFVISRYRNERRRGSPKEAALLAAMGTSGKAVVFAGSTVLLAVSGMFLVRDSTFTSLGFAALVVVALAVIMSATLLPALLAMLGDNLERFRVPFIGADRGGEGIWGYISDRVLARPALLASVTLVALLALAAPVLTLNLGFNGSKSLSKDLEATKAMTALEDNFTLGLTSPAFVVLDAGRDQNVFAPALQSSVQTLVSSAEAEAASADNPEAYYGTPIQRRTNDAGNAEMVLIPINADTGEKKGIQAVDHLRNDLIPTAFDGEPRPVVTGATAGNIDFKTNILFRTPIVFSFVLGLTFIILLISFRSIVVAVKAIILNLLSVGAAYGLVVLVFQRGWLLEGALNFQATGIIESWLPLFLFSILFGLSMDYHMFVLSRIKEAYEHGMSSDEAVSVGIKATAGTITSAAAVMVAVAAIFAFTRFIGIKQFGFGLAVAILIDATVIRSILLPASMKLLGDWNWYLPKWLEWLPHVRMAE